MIAALAVEVGIPVSVLMSEPPEYLEAMMNAAIDRAQAASATPGQAGNVPGLEDLLGER